MQKCKNAELIPSRSCDAIAHTSHEMHSAPLAKCEEKEEAERRRHDQFLSWCVAKGTSMSTRTLHSVAHESVYFSDPFGLRRMAAENGKPLQPFNGDPANAKT